MQIEAVDRGSSPESLGEMLAAPPEQASDESFASALDAVLTRASESAPEEEPAEPRAGEVASTGADPEPEPELELALPAQGTVLLAALGNEMRAATPTDAATDTEASAEPLPVDVRIGGRAETSAPAENAVLRQLTEARVPVEAEPQGSAGAVPRDAAPPVAARPVETPEAVNAVRAAAPAGAAEAVAVAVAAPLHANARASGPGNPQAEPRRLDRTPRSEAVVARAGETGVPDRAETSRPVEAPRQVAESAPPAAASQLGPESGTAPGTGPVPVGAPAAGPSAPPSGPVTPASAPQPIEALPAQIQLLSEQGGGIARVRLHPAELGEVEITVRLRGGTVDVVVRAEEPAAQLAVMASREQLVDALGSRELRVQSFEVSGRQDQDAAGGQSFRDAPDQGPGYQRNASPGLGAPSASGVEGAQLAGSSPPVNEAARSASRIDLRI